MKFCINCGKELQEGAKACGYCGMIIDGQNVGAGAANNTGAANVGTVVNVQSTSVKSTNGMAIVGFVLSLVSSLCCCGAFNFISLILSIVGLVQSKNMNGSGRGLAIAGIIISAIMIIIGIILIIFGYGAAIFEELS